MAQSDGVYTMLTDMAIKLLEDGIIFWRKPWKGPSDAPQNLWSHHHRKGGGHYNGVNVFALHGRRLKFGYRSPWWLTPAQASKFGGKVREDQLYKNAGPGGSLVIFWMLKDTDKLDSSGKPKKFPILRFSSVYHVEQCEGLDGIIPIQEVQLPEFTPIEQAEQIIAGRPEPVAPISHDGGNKAYYTPSKHTIHMPDPQMFLSAESYYSTLFHEVTHSTGKATGRKTDWTGFGSDPYAIEELVAEMGATALRSRCGIDGDDERDQSAAYLAGWVKRFREQRDMLAKAAKAAEIAVRYICNETTDSPAAVREEVEA